MTGRERESTVTSLLWRDGDRETIRVPADETVLSAAERADVGLPFGCRTGACGTCTARLVEGALEHRRPPRALKERHLTDGYALLCISVPETDCTIEVGTDVHADLLTNPWE